MNRVTTSLADLRLTRYPETQNAREPLRAWDAADEYLLRHVTGTHPVNAANRANAVIAAGAVRGAGGGADAGAGHAGGAESVGSDAGAAEPVDLSGTVVVLGDRWGALAAALAQGADPARLVQITDSYLTQRATRANLARLGIAEDAVTLASTCDAPPDRIDVLLVRVPKSLALLEDQLCRLSRHIHAGTVVVGSGMVTEIHTSTLNLFDRIIGPTRTSLAVRKARLIFAAPDLARPRAADPWPRGFRLPADVGLAAGRTVVNHGGVFAGERLDIGARFFLRHLPWEPGGSRTPDRPPAGSPTSAAATASWAWPRRWRTRRPRSPSWTSPTRPWPPPGRPWRRTDCSPTRTRPRAGPPAPGSCCRTASRRPRRKRST